MGKGTLGGGRLCVMVKSGGGTEGKGSAGRSGSTRSSMADEAE